jgi:hypothetical protein
MDWYDLYALLVIGAVAPYVTEAAISWLMRFGKHKDGANAPT